MKRILVPTDFSVNAREAFVYAIALARKQHASITLYHAWHTPVLDPTLSFAQQSGEMEHDKKKKDRRLKAWSQLAEKSKVKCDHIWNEQGLAGGINDILGSGEYDLVVMGTKGASGIRSVIIGSNTAAVLEDSPVPVLAVPRRSKFNGWKDIAFAVNYEEGVTAAVKYITGLAELFKSRITFLHIAGTEYTDDFEEYMMKKFAAEVSKATGYKKVIFDIETNEDLVKGLNSFIERGHTDVMAMVKWKRSFAAKIFLGDITKQMTFCTKVPLLVIPFNNK